MADDADKPLAGTYVKVILLEAAIIFMLWLLGRAFS
jgi:hypothetical protein